MAATTRGLQSILVPTDFSTGAQAALERAMLLPLAPKAKITVLHVMPADIPGKLRKEAVFDGERGIEMQLAHARQIAIDRGLPPLQLVGDVVEGNTPHHVMKRANTVEADLICIGRHGRRGVVDLFVGSTASRVLRQSEHPLLLVRSNPTGPYERPFIAVDPSHRALTVVKAGVSLVRPNSRVTVFTATPIPYEDFVSIGNEERSTLRKRFEKEGEKALAAMLRKVPGFAYEPVARSGDARSLVVEEAQRRGADLTVVGSHGRKTLDRLLVGSVAEWVLAHARNDVLVIRP